jgi:nicotinate-nucleotide pyrophosphorylase (carboxylating)
MNRLHPLQLEPIARLALLEDLGQGDLTTDALPLDTTWGVFELRPRQACVISGLEIAQCVFTQVDPAIQFTSQAQPGTALGKDALIATVEGPVVSILKAERTALNFLQHLSGIATETHRFTERLQGTGCKVTDTRKTTPGLRILEKKAVIDGGGHPHRFNLGSAVMLKDNHLQAVRAGQISLNDLVTQIRDRISHTATIEIEVETLDEVRQAVEAGADILLLDNMPPEMVRQAVSLITGRAVIEASGGIHLETARDYAEAGAQYLSTSKITLGAPAIDIGLDCRSVQPG